MTSPKSKNPPVTYDPELHVQIANGKFQSRVTKRLVGIDPSTLPEELRPVPKPKAPPRTKPPAKVAPEAPRNASAPEVIEGPSKVLGPAQLPTMTPEAPRPEAPKVGASATPSSGATSTTPHSTTGPAFASLPEVDGAAPAAPNLPGLGLAPSGPAMGTTGHLCGCWKADSIGAPCPCGETVYPDPSPARVKSWAGYMEAGVNMLASRRGGAERPFSAKEQAFAEEVSRAFLKRYGMSGGKHGPALDFGMLAWMLMNERAERDAERKAS